MRHWKNSRPFIAWCARSLSGSVLEKGSISDVGASALGEALKLSAGICVSYILGQGYVDAAEKKAIAASSEE